jgi:uncharacterized protein YcbK (DUF882 family)
MNYFTMDEFKCKCGCGRHVTKMDSKFLRRLDRARAIAEYPFVITSGYRCPTYNMTIGGKKKSAHISGNAVDIRVQHSHARYKILHGLIMAEFHRIGVGPDFIHADDDPNLPNEVCWDYY